MEWTPSRRRPPWRAWLGTVVVLVVFGLVTVAWIRDVPDASVELRADMFLLLVLMVAVLGYTLEGAAPSRSPESRQGSTGTSNRVLLVVMRTRRSRRVRPGGRTAR